MRIRTVHPPKLTRCLQFAQCCATPWFRGGSPAGGKTSTPTRAARTRGRPLTPRPILCCRDGLSRVCDLGGASLPRLQVLVGHSAQMDTRLDLGAIRFACVDVGQPMRICLLRAQSTVAVPRLPTPRCRRSRCFRGDCSFRIPAGSFRTFICLVCEPPTPKGNCRLRSRHSQGRRRPSGPHSAVTFQCHWTADRGHGH